MTYPYADRNRVRRNEVIVNNVSGACSAGTVTFNVDTPRGAWAYGFAFEVVANDAPVVVTLTPWVDREQTLLADSSYKFLKTGNTTATTNLTMAITSTKIGAAGVIIPAGDQYGAAAPILPVYGAQVTISTTASTGTWEATYSGVEI